MRIIIKILMLMNKKRRRYKFFKLKFESKSTFEIHMDVNALHSISFFLYNRN